MRPAYFTPKLTNACRLEIRRLRRENPREWTLAKLALKFGVNRSTISNTLRRRPRVNAEQELECLRLVEESSGPISIVELFQRKQQEWSRELVTECDLVRQQQLVNLIKSVESMLDPEKLREREERYRKPYDPAEEERRLAEILKAWDAEKEQAGAGSNQSIEQPNGAVVGTA